MVISENWFEREPGKLPNAYHKKLPLYKNTNPPLSSVGVNAISHFLLSLSRLWRCREIELQVKANRRIHIQETHETRELTCLLLEGNQNPMITARMRQSQV